METTYAFKALYSGTIYGYGTEAEASQYLEWLNQKRETNLYGMSLSDLTSEQADTMAINLLDFLKDMDLVEYADD